MKVFISTIGRPRFHSGKVNDNENACNGDLIVYIYLFM